MKTNAWRSLYLGTFCPFLGVISAFRFSRAMFVFSWFEVSNYRGRACLYLTGLSDAGPCASTYPSIWVTYRTFQRLLFGYYSSTITLKFQTLTFYCSSSEGKTSGKGKSEPHFYYLASIPVSYWIVKNRFIEEHILNSIFAWLWNHHCSWQENQVCCFKSNIGLEWCLSVYHSNTII